MIVFIFAGLCLLALAGNDCCNRLYPTGITADSVLNSNYPPENLLDDNQGTHWISANGDSYCYVYIDFANDVEIMHILVLEMHEYAQQIRVYDGISGALKTLTNNEELENWKIYNFHFTDFVTSKVNILFSGSFSKQTRARVSTISFWGRNMTTTTPTTVPTVSLTLPTNSTTTVAPTMYPTVSPTPTEIVGLFPSLPPTMQPTVSPSTAPTSTLLPSSSPTITYSDHDAIFSIGVAEFLGVAVFFLIVGMIFLCFKLRKREEVYQANLKMGEMHDLPDRL